jgi:hypothetical protein
METTARSWEGMAKPSPSLICLILPTQRRALKIVPAIGVVGTIAYQAHVALTIAAKRAEPFHLQAVAEVRLAEPVTETIPLRGRRSIADGPWFLIFCEGDTP